MVEKQERPRGYTDSGLVPIPDPTTLTTSQLDRAIEGLTTRLNDRFITLENAIKASALQFEAERRRIEEGSIARYTALKELAEERIGAIRQLFEERELRTKAISDHISVAREESVRFARESLESRNLIQAHEEKFRSVQQQFRDNKTAVDAALIASKDAVERQNQTNLAASSKSEAAFTKQIDQLQYLTQQSTKAMDDKIDDLKARIQALEGVRKGGSEVLGWVIGAGGVLVAIVTVIVMVIRHST